jgi:hypothetical protein
MALRILDWDLCMMPMLDLLAQPNSYIQWFHIGLIAALTLREKIFWEICGYKKEKIAEK